MTFAFSSVILCVLRGFYYYRFLKLKVVGKGMPAIVHTAKFRYCIYRYFLEVNNGR
jgi:hypothetical protein